MSNHIYWKLQSVQQSAVLSPFSKEFDLYRERFKKDFETRELMSETETIQHYNKHSWKQPMFSKIYSLTIAFVEKESVRIKFITGEEKDIIQTFLNTLKNEHFKEFQVTHFGAEVILPYLGTRMDLNGFRTSLPIGLVYKNLRPWNLAGLCVRDFYTGAGNYKYSLKELAWIYGLETNYIEPVDEFTFFQAGKFQELKQSAIDEIFTLVNVHRLMTGENKLEDVVATEQVVEKVEEIKPSNFLELLYTSQSMSQEVRDGLTQKLSKKKMTKRDREIMREIILGTYIQNDFINGQQDSKAAIEKKTKEVDEFLKAI
jgi:hypothetical protein